MWTAIACAAGFGLLLWAVVRNVKSSARASAQLEALKAETARRAEEQERANQIRDNVRMLSDDDVRRRLQNIAGKK